MASIEKASKFTANDLNRKIEIVEAVTETDENGNRYKHYRPLSKVWANVSITSAKNDNGDETHRVVNYRLVYRYSKIYEAKELRYIYDKHTLKPSAPIIRLDNNMRLVDCYGLVGEDE